MHNISFDTKTKTSYDSTLKKHHDLGKPVLLLTMDNEIEAEMLLEMLREQHIPALKKSPGAGAYLSIYAGFTTLSVKIYVP
ncbi:MAG: DUF2007 domain-containing protein [Clostridiales bacterium]|nr:DUF2007 domain-containing protein [Clostridiales bacterium]